MYNVHTYFSLKNLVKKKCTLYMAKYGNLIISELIQPETHLCISVTQGQAI